MVEVGALLVSILIGMIIGFSSFWATDDLDVWPTNEMSSRGDITGLLTGIAIAIPSGMGVALSLLGNNTASLVGVAISASLLPPAVNAGICWSHAILIEANVIDRLKEKFPDLGRWRCMRLTYLGSFEYNFFSKASCKPAFITSIST